MIQSTLCRSSLFIKCIIGLSAGLTITWSAPFNVAAAESSAQERDCSRFASIEKLARDGDLVFRRGRSVESRMVLALDRLGYSHVGLIRITPQGSVVIHSSPRNGDGLGGHVEETFLREYLSSERAEAAALYRPTGVEASVARVATSWAYDHVLQATPFDSSFDATNSAALYCTELIWEAYRSAGVNLLPDYDPHDDSSNRHGAIETPIGFIQEDYNAILPSDLAESSFMQPVVEVDQTKSECP